jgi:O-acetylhomoserine (thiol)-lyase
MERHAANARAVAEFLQRQPEVAWVRAPQLGAVFTFGLHGGRDAGRRCIDAMTLWSHLANVGDAKSLIIHPASTTHSQLSDAELQAAGVPPESVRLSVGLEDVDDLLWDLERGLRAAGRQAAIA